MNVLFLDDMIWRHSGFSRIIDKMVDVKLHKAYNAADAITYLENEKFDQAFLDHDLSEEDVMMAVGGKSTVPTGMAVVDFIVKMSNPPLNIIIHSCNIPASLEMEARLKSHPSGITVTRTPFPYLIDMIKSANSHLFSSI